jgi:hypothetical protein
LHPRTEEKQISQKPLNHTHARAHELTASHQKHYKALLILFLAKVRFASKKSKAESQTPLNQI